MRLGAHFFKTTIHTSIQLNAVEREFLKKRTLFEHHAMPIICISERSMIDDERLSLYELNAVRFRIWNMLIKKHMLAIWTFVSLL